jgi:energy-coupling factor transporter ATP-binding protein EcfA2
MPDFDKNLNPILVNSNKSALNLPNPATPTPNTYSDLGGGKGPQRSATDAFFGSGPTVTPMLPTVSAKQLYENRRYGLYNENIVDIEDQKAYAQSNWDKAANGILKGLNLAGTTIAGSFGMLYGAAKSPFTGRLADIWDNEVMRGLDDWNNEVDQTYLPNYYTNVEKQANWYSTDNWFTTNFLFDKLIKNSGYAVGAMFSGNVANAGLLRAGSALGKIFAEGAALAESSQAFKLFTPLLRNTARAFSAGKNIEAASILEKEISSIADITAKSSDLAKIAKTTGDFARFNDAARRTAVAVYSSAGESAFESLQTAKQFKETLIEKYRDTFKTDPTGDALAEIEQKAEQVGKISFFGNMALLSVTEFAQLPYLLGSSYKSSRQAANSFAGKVDDVVFEDGKYIAKVPKTKLSKAYEKVTGIGAYVFDPKEAFQEVGQYALQVGTQNYFKKAGETDAADAWTDGFLYGFVGRDKEGVGEGAFVSKEGMESLLLGGITGGLMQAKGRFQEGKQKAQNTERFLNIINDAPSFRDAFKDRLNSINRGVVLQQQHEAAVITGNELEARDLQTDMMHNYLATRVKYGRFDMVMDDISNLRRDASTEGGLSELKAQGIGNINDTVESFQKRLNNFERVAKNTNEIYNSLNVRYGGEKTDEGELKYSPYVIDKMAYAASKIADYDVRIPQLNNILLDKGIVIGDVLDNVLKGVQSSRKATAEALNQINELPVVSTTKDGLKTALQDIITLGERRKLFLEEYEDIKNNPLNYQTDPEFKLGDKVEVPVEIGEPKKKFEIGKEYSLVEPLKKDGTNLYLAPKLTVLSQTLGGELEVKLPGGKIKFIAPEDLKDYNISEEDNASPEMEETLDKSIDAILSKEEYKELPKIQEGQSKLDYINSIGEQKLIDDVEKEFNTRTEDLIKRREEERKKQEELIKNKAELDKQQAEVENKSATVETPPPPTAEELAKLTDEESKLKSWRTLFTSGTSPTERPDEPVFIRNSREFLNNAKNFKNRGNLAAILVTANNQTALGLNGLAQLSFGVDVNTDIKNLPNEGNTDNAILMQVFVEQDAGKTYFVNKNGERIGELGKPVDIQQVIFQTMPTTSLFFNKKDKNGKPIPRYRANEKAEAEAASKAWSTKRVELFTAPAFPVKAYRFAISRGVAEIIKLNDEYEKNHVGGVLIPENKIATQEGLLQVVTKGFVVHNGENIKFKNGLTVLQYSDTLEILNNNKFGTKKAEAIHLAIKTMMEKFQQTKKLDVNLATYIQNVLFWKKSTSTYGNQIFINTSTGEISLGGKNYTVSDFDNKKTEIVNQLKDQFHAINNTTLKNSFYENFYEYVVEDGKLTEIEWPNYQSYLLSSKGRSAEETPLVTKVAKPTDAIPYSFKQKYATLIDFELPVIQAPKPSPVAEKAAAEGKPMIGEFVMDGETKQTFNGFNSGPVDFIGTIDADGKLFVDIIINDTVKNAARNTELVNNTIVPLLKGLGKFDPSADDLELVTTFIANKLMKELIAFREASPAPTAATVTPTGPEVTTATGAAPVSTDGAKADIEKRRQETNNKNEKFWKQFTAINAEEVADRDNLINKLIKDIQLPANTRINNWSLEELIDGKWVGKKITNQEEYFGKENWNKIKEAKKQFDIEFKKIEDSNLAKIALIEQKQSDLLNTIDGLELRKAWSFGLIEEPNIVGLDDTNFISKETEFKNGDLVETDNYEGYYYLSKPDKDGDWYEVIKGKTEQEVKDKINAKYDAELAALEGAKPTEETYNPNETGLPDDEYMRVGVTGADVEALNDAQIEIFKQWTAEKVPGIPYEILDNLVDTYDNEKAFGVFEKNVAKFYKGAPGTTPYHEIFEGIWKGFLTPEQRQLILDEFKSKSGQFTDRASGKKINYAEATDRQAKERIADDFGMFRVGKLPARTLGERILKFFRDIIEFFKSFVQKPSMKRELFKAIEAGKFKSMTLSASLATAAPEYMRVPGLTETQVFEFVQDMTARAAAYIFGDSKKSLYDLKKITGFEIFDRIKEAYTKENKYQTLGDSRYNKLITRTKENLRTLGINFNEEDTIDINDENVTSRDYAPEPFSTDWKKTSAFVVKFITATLPEVMPTNQKNATSLKLPERATSSVKGFKLNNFGKIFNTLLDKLSNTSSVSKLEKELTNLATNDGNYVRLFQRLGGKMERNNEGESFVFDFANFKNEDWRLFINFFQTFTKQKPDAVIQYIDGASTYTAPANQFTTSKLLQSEWFENMKVLSDDPKSIIKRNKTTKTFDVDVSKLPTAVPKQPQDMINFLNEFGVEFPLSAYVSLKDDQKEDFADAVGGIFTYIQKSPSVGTLRGKTLGINPQLSELANLYISATNPSQDTTYFGVDNERIQSYAENNVPSVMENEFNSVATVEELKQLRPELNDVFTKNSVTLKSGGNFYNSEGNQIKKLKIGYIQGTKEIDSDKGVTTSRLTLGKRFTQEINQNLDGNYYILVPADGSTEWTINLGNHMTYADVVGGRAWTKINRIFKGYLIDEVSLALDADNRKKIRNVGDKANQLRFFKEILSDKDVKNIEGLIAEGKTQEQIEKYIDDNIESINAAIANFINDTVAETKELLIKNGEISQIKEDQFSYDGLQDAFALKNDINKFKMTSDDVNNLLTFVNANYIINNIELHKIIFGDPYEFAVKNGKLDATKRIKSFLSPRRTIFDNPAYNSFLNTEYNMAGNIALSPEDPGYHLHKSYTNTVTLTDVKLSSDLYPEINEADAASFIMDTTYREVKLKNGQWIDEISEPWHQWQMAYTRNKLAAKGEYTYTNEKLQKADSKLISKPEPVFVTDVLKPVVTGVKAGETKIDNVLDKFSQMPLYYKAIEGTNLEKLYIKMWKENIGYAVFESGRKVGITKTFNLYNGDGTLNNQPFNKDVIIKVPWKAYGIQVETSYENPKDQTRGSQLTKLSSLDLFANGEASQEAKKAYERNLKALDMLHENAYKTLLNKLGIEDLGDGFRLVNPAAIQESLEYELLRRKMSENAKDTIKRDENGEFIIPFEASPAYKQIKDILFSMLNKSLNSPKMNGGPKVQVSVTLWENEAEGRGLVIKTDTGYKKISRKQYEKLSEEDKKKVKLTSDTLKFYTKEHPYIEVMLPHWFRNKFSKNKFPNDEAILKYLNSTEEGKSILKGVGFRIPTQAMSSVEVFRVKGFLPQSMGDTIVVPSEITAKAGSDFDIDKLNTYLKSIYVDKNGDIRLVKYQGSEEATKEFFANVFDETLEKKKVKKAELLEASQILSLGLDDPNGLLDRYSNLLDVLLEDVTDSSEFEEKIIEELERLGDVNFQEKLKEKFVEDMYTRSLQNEYYESLEQMITLPENFERLIAPVNDAGLSNIAAELDKLTGEDETKIKSRLLRRSFMTTLRNAFVTAKKWVGIAAVNITGQSLTQKSQVYINPVNFEALSEFDKKILGNGKINLPHNTTTVDGVEYASISGKYTADGKQFISDRLSGYATSFVDVSKDPYIMKIIRSNSIVGTFMFLERMGVGENTIWFLNQPIIREYLSYLDSIDKKGLFGKKDGEYIRSMFPTKTEVKDFDPGTLKDNIEKYYTKKELDEYDNAVQQLIFNEFLKYAKMAQYSFKLTQATNYDTTKFRNSDQFTRKKTKTTEAREKNIFSSVDKILDSSFIGKQAELTDFAMSAMGSVIKTESDEYTIITDSVLKPFMDLEYISDDQFNKVAGKIKASFLDYIIQTQSTLGSEIKALVVDNTSVADQLVQAKKRHPEMKILNELHVVSSDRIGGAKSVRLRANVKDTYDENMYTDMMRELKIVEPELYNGLLKLAVLQGVYQSSISIKNIMPIEDYAPLIKKTIDTLSSTENVKNFSKGAFYRNNWKDSSMVPFVQPKFFLAQEDPVSYDDITGVDTYLYYSPLFPNIEPFGVKSLDRKVLLLSEKYNHDDIQYNFVKIPRVVTDRKTGERIDMLTGLSVSNADFAKRKAAGDMSLKDVYGYQKVKYGNGEPVVTAKGEHVYKLVNLYGDGQLVSEYYPDNRPSVINNGTVKIDNEVSDADLIRFYGNQEVIAPAPAVPVTPQPAPAAPTGKTEFDKLPAKADVTINEQLTERTSEEPKGNIFEARNVQINYTEGQRKALSDVQNLIDANKQGYYLLAGYAGTGKTTIAENIARYAQLKGRPAVVLAPTNKAAKVLNDKLKTAGVSSEATTIHKAIYGEPDPLTGEWVIGAAIKNSVLIIDESSMISKELMNDLIGATNKNNILIFMGDSFQLEPVGEDSGLFKGKVTEVKNSQTELTEVKRQSLDSNVLKVATLTRIEGKPYIPATSIQDFKVAKSRSEFIDDFKSAIKNGEDVVMIVATNNERIAMNNVARQEKFGAQKTILNGGDVMISVANSTAYPNSEMFVIDKIDDSVKEEIYLETKDGKSIKYDGFFTNVVTKDGKNVTMLHIPLLDKPSFYHAQLMQYARKNPNFMDFLESRGLIMETKKGPKLSPSLVIATYGYSVTAHKSQGSQWSKVFVNQNYVAPTWNGARWYYTAITRSSKDVIVLNSGNNVSISEAEMNSKLNVEFSPEQSTKDVQPKLEIPAYTVNRDLKNADGTKRFAQTNGKQIILNPINSLKEFFDYFEGKEGGPTSIQKQKVLDALSKSGWSIERIKSTLNTAKLVNTFLVLHEQSHIDNNDKDVYWVNGKDLMTDDKVAIETRASLDALNKLSLNAQQEFPDKPLDIQNVKCNG